MITNDITKNLGPTERKKFAFIWALIKNFELSVINKHLTRNYSAYLLHFLLERYGATILTLKYWRTINASIFTTFYIHNNIGHSESTNKSIIINENLWHSIDYVVGLTSSDPWIIHDPRTTGRLLHDDVLIRNGNHYTTGYFGTKSF